MVQVQRYKEHLTYELPSNPYELLEFDSDVTGIQPHMYHRIFAELQSH